MNKFFFIICGWLMMVSCGQSRENSQKPNSVVSDTIKTIKKPQLSTKPLSIEDQLKTEIDSIYRHERVKCSYVREAVTLMNGKQEFWSICNSSEIFKIIKIKSHDKDELFEEVYLLKNNELVYAEESILYTPINHFVQQNWRCHFYIKKGDLITISSLGHGKTEDDQWQPESILTTFKTRKTQLSNIK